ncbi:hypothetical protein HDU97_007979 [Phlyctochytrium planicorne]|nr:hypothetical protein HDU97_007979 [Phlyctochytrium planicorne]
MKLLSVSTPTGRWLLNIVNFAALTISILSLVLLTRAASDPLQEKGRQYFNSIATLLLLAVFKSIISGALYFYHRYFAGSVITSDKEESLLGESFGEAKSMAILGSLYSILGVLGHNPFSPDSFSSPSIAQLVSFVLTPIALMFLQFEKLDHLRWMSLSLIAGAMSNLVALYSSKDEIFKYFIVTAHTILRILHSMELKKGSRGSIHSKNIILSLSSLGTLAFLFVMEISGILVVRKDGSFSRSVPMASWIFFVLLQSVVELIATGVFKYSNTIVSELSIVISIFLSILAASKGETADLFSLKLTCSIVAIIAVVQYFSGANTSSAPLPSYESHDKHSRSMIGVDGLLEDDEEDIASSKNVVKTTQGWKSTLLPVAVIALIVFGFASKNVTFTKTSAPAIVVEEDDEMNLLQASKAPTNRSRWHNELDDGDAFYDRGFAVVIPSFMPHFDYLKNLLRSFEKYCTDCEKVRFLIIPSQKELQAFETLQKEFPFFKRLEVRAFSDIYPDLRDPVLNMTEHEFLKEKIKYTFQSMKKMMGCLHMNATYCWMLDSESFMFQNTSLKTMVKNYMLDPHIVHSSHEKHNNVFTITAKEFFGYKEYFGWVLEEYLWFVETEILKEIKHILDLKFPTVRDLPVFIFVEVIYFIYILHNKQDYWQYRIVDSSNVFGPMWDYALNAVRVDSNKLASIEELRHVMSENPGIVAPLAERYTSYGLNFFKAFGELGSFNTSAEFLDLAYSVTMCVSEQDPQIYETAMNGRWANRQPTFSKRQIEDFCVNSKSIC